MASAKEEVKRLLKIADIEIDGKRDSDITIHDERIYKRVLSEANMGLGEGYMDGWWTTKSIDKFIYKIMKSNLKDHIKITPSIIKLYLRAKLSNKQKSRALNIGEWHYDIGNDLYKSMLDNYMQYSCAYFKGTEDLEKAQINKMDLICKKLQLKKGETLLDIGCGWGGLLNYAAKKYGIKGLGITVSKEQAKIANERNKGLPVEIKVVDYRKINQKFDKIVSVGMIEHVGPKNYKEYMKTASNCLKEKGLFLLHTIGGKKSNSSGEAWMDKYIFPDGVIPSVKQLSKAVEKYFIIEDLHNFGAYYDKTLLVWNKNFQKSWKKLSKKYDERFKRMWEYYILSCAGSFRARHLQLWQIVLSKGRDGVYNSIR